MKFTASFLSAAVTACLFLIAAATPKHKTKPITSQVCTRGTVRVCCEDIRAPDAVDVRTRAILAILGVKVPNLKGVVGTTCSALDSPVRVVKPSWSVSVLLFLFYWVWSSF